MRYKYGVILEAANEKTLEFMAWVYQCLCSGTFDAEAVAVELEKRCFEF